MGMGVNRSRKNVFPFGIDDLIGRIIQICTNGLDFVAIGKYIGQIATRSVYDGSALK
jgi:hypothetical protein